MSCNPAWTDYTLLVFELEVEHGNATLHHRGLYRILVVLRWPLPQVLTDWCQAVFR